MCVCVCVCVCGWSCACVSGRWEHFRNNYLRHFRPKEVWSDLFGCSDSKDVPWLSLRIISHGSVRNSATKQHCIEPILHRSTGDMRYECSLLRFFSFFFFFITSCVHLMTKFNLHKFPFSAFFLTL